MNVKGAVLWRGQNKPWANISLCYFPDSLTSSTATPTVCTSKEKLRAGGNFEAPPYPLFFLDLVTPFQGAGLSWPHRSQGSRALTPHPAVQ